MVRLNVKRIRTKEVIKRYLKSLLNPKKTTEAITRVNGVMINMTRPNVIIFIALEELGAEEEKLNCDIKLLTKVKKSLPPIFHFMVKCGLLLIPLGNSRLLIRYQLVAYLELSRR